MISPWHDRARSLLEDWERCRYAKPRGDVVDLQIDKDQLQRWAGNLRYNLLWSQDLGEMAESCHQFEHRLHNYKEKIIIEILTHGTI